MHWRVRQFIEVMSGYKRRSRILLWNWRSRSFPKGVDGFFQLHIGCGEIDSAEFVNIDARAHPHVHLVTRNLFDLQSVPDAVASLVYMCHVLEHVPQAMVHKVLLEMRRVLKPGGTLRLSVPDFELILAMYETTQRDPNLIVGPLMGGQDYEFNFHYSIFASNNLSAALTKAGFINVRNWDPMDCDFHNFDDWASKSVHVAGRDFPISLNLEATTLNIESAHVARGAG